jgi:hypothetical protein
MPRESPATCPVSGIATITIKENKAFLRPKPADSCKKLSMLKFCADLDNPEGKDQA